MDNWLTREEPPGTEKSSKMKQMEISLKLGVETKPVETSSKSIKLSKEENLARAAIGCKKMTDWLVAAPSIERSWRQLKKFREKSK